MTNKLKKLYETLNKPRKELLIVVIPILVVIALSIVGYGFSQLKHQHDDRDKFISFVHKISKIEPEFIFLTLNSNSPVNKKCVKIVDDSDLKKAMKLLGNAGGDHYQSHAREKEQFKMVLAVNNKQYQFLGKIYQDSPTDSFVSRQFIYEDEKDYSPPSVVMPLRITGLGSWVVDKYKASEPCK